MLKRGSVLFVFLALLFACAQDGKQTDGTEKSVKKTTGLREIGILAKGMEWLSWTRGVRDALTRLDGVQTVRIDLQSNRVTITPKQDREFPLSSIPERIKEAGFVPDDMYIVASGIVEEKDGNKVFRIENGQRTFPLKMEDPPDGPITLRANVDFDREPPLLTERKRKQEE